MLKPKKKIRRKARRRYVPPLLSMWGKPGRKRGGARLFRPTMGGTSRRLPARVRVA